MKNNELCIKQSSLFYLFVQWYRKLEISVFFLRASYAFGVENGALIIAGCV